MLTITLPNGQQKQFDAPVSVAHIAQSIGAGLAKAAVAAKVNDKLVDTSYVVTDDANLKIITLQDPDALEVIRHSAAHLLAQAVKRLYPQAQVTIGPVVEDGFYYDFAYEPGFSEEDFAAIEKEMESIVAANLPVTRRELDRAAAMQLFFNMGEVYKTQIIESIPGNEVLSVYEQGDFVDLCRGPHVPSTGFLKAFKLTKVAGAYWRGDANNEMLQRIYGTAWADEKALKAYLHRIEEAQKRDHRKLGKALHLFHFQEEAPGMVFWHDKGWTIYRLVEDMIRKHIRANGYQEVRTPQILDRSLWEKSGHWDKFRGEMFVTQSEDRDFAIKPMNCPCHVQIFNQGLKSYRDLPLRLAEFGSCHRNELSGALHGLMRVRNFVQDDAHIFCAENDIQAEAAAFIELLFKVYEEFGFTDIKMQLSTRPEERVGSDELWDKAESALQSVIEATGLPWGLNVGDGAFYGPKISFYLQDCIGRVWQCGTLQLDFSMPERLGATYIAEDGSKKVPVMLHRAILGSIERFIGILIEHHAGKFPFWLAPVQAALLTITDSQVDYAKKVAKTLQDQGFRVITDLRNEKIGFKIREHTLQQVPYLLIIGDREVEGGILAVRTQSGQDLGSLTPTDLMARWRNERP
jgi:threonyl-tRNA synthetase